MSGVLQRESEQEHLSWFPASQPVSWRIVQKFLLQSASSPPPPPPLHPRGGLARIYMHVVGYLGALLYMGKLFNEAIEQRMD